jgi:hypothetical protein
VPDGLLSTQAIATAFRVLTHPTTRVVDGVVVGGNLPEGAVVEEVLAADRAHALDELEQVASDEAADNAQGECDNRGRRLVARLQSRASVCRPSDTQTTMVPPTMRANLVRVLRERRVRGGLVVGETRRGEDAHQR